MSKTASVWIFQKIISITKSHYIVDKENNFIGVVKKNKYSYEIRYIMTYCKVLRKIIDVTTKQIKIEYEYNNGIEIDTVQLDGESLSKFGLKTLLSYGVRFNETDIDEVNKYLMNTDMKAEIVYGYSKLGWDKIDNNLVFRYNHLIANEQLSKEYIYNGSLCLNHKGTLDEWCNMIQNEVCGNIPMTYLLMASFSSPLLSMLNYTHDFGSVLFCLCNSSSKGKSTTAMLCASIYSSPVLNKGVAISFNGTENALQEFLSQINGLSVVFDELGASTISNLERVLYSFCLGRSKLRLNGDASLQDVKEFSSVIFTTSEISFISEKSMDGIKTRVFQIEDTLTKNAQNSDNIKNIVMQNYGVAGNEYLQMFVNKGQEIIEADYQKYKDMLIKNSKELDEKLQVKGSNILTDSTLAAYEQKKRLTDRILSKLAIVVQAAEYAKELFNFNIEISDMIDYSLNLTNAIESAQTPEDELLTIVHEDFVKNIRKYKMNYPFALKIFGKRKAEAIDYNSINIGYVGLIRLSASDNYYEICVAKNYFEQLMKNNQISDFRKRLKNLRASGILVAEKDRLVAREKIIEIIDLKVYIFRFLFDDKMVSLHNACKETYFDKIENSDNIDFLSDDEVQNIEECLGGE